MSLSLTTVAVLTRDSSTPSTNTWQTLQMKLLPLRHKSLQRLRLAVRDGQVNMKTYLEARDDIFVLEGTRCSVVLGSRGERPASYTYVGPLLLRGEICAYSTSHGVEDHHRDHGGKPHLRKLEMQIDYSEDKRQNSGVSATVPGHVRGGGGDKPIGAGRQGNGTTERASGQAHTDRSFDTYTRVHRALHVTLPCRVGTCRWIN